MMIVMIILNNMMKLNNSVQDIVSIRDRQELDTVSSDDVTSRLRLLTDSSCE
jgi:hypothetical protein